VGQDENRGSKAGDFGEELVSRLLSINEVDSSAAYAEWRFGREILQKRQYMYLVLFFFCVCRHRRENNEKSPDGKNPSEHYSRLNMAVKSETVCLS